MAGHPMGPGTRPPTGFGAVIKGEVAHGDVGVNPFTGERGRTSTKGGAGFTPVQGSGEGGQGSMSAQQANSMNEYAFQKQMNVWEHGQKLAGQDTLEENQRRREGQSIRDQLAASALSKLSMTSPEDVRDISRVHQHLGEGDDYGVKAHIDSYNSRRNGAMSSAQMQEHVEEAAPEGVKEAEPFTTDGGSAPGGEPVDADEGSEVKAGTPEAASAPDAPEPVKEPELGEPVKEETPSGFTPVGEEGKKEDVGTAPPGPEAPPAEGVSERTPGAEKSEPEPEEVKTPESNVGAAAAGNSPDDNKEFQDKPAVQEAAAGNPVPEQVATPPSSAGNSAPQAPTPENQEPAISDSVNNDAKPYTPEDEKQAVISTDSGSISSPHEDTGEVPVVGQAQPEPEPQNKRQRAAHFVRGAVQDFQEKAAARNVENEAAEADLQARREAAGAPPLIQHPGLIPKDEAIPDTPSRRNAGFGAGAGAGLLGRVGANLQARMQPVPNEPDEPATPVSEAPKEEPKEESHIVRDLITVGAEAAKGGAKGATEGNLAAAASAAAGPEGPPVVKGAFVGRGVAKGVGKGVGKVAARRAADRAVRSVKRKKGQS